MGSDKSVRRIVSGVNTITPCANVQTDFKRAFLSYQPHVVVQFYAKKWKYKLLQGALEMIAASAVFTCNARDFYFSLTNCGFQVSAISLMYAVLLTAVFGSMYLPLLIFIGLWDVEAPTFYRQSAHRWRSCSLMRRLPFTVPQPTTLPRAPF
jgi:hypothetical protein